MLAYPLRRLISFLPLLVTSFWYELTGGDCYHQPGRFERWGTWEKP